MALAFSIPIGVIAGLIAGYFVAQLLIAVPIRRGRLPKRCSACTHFNLAEGQAAMRQHPVFMQAAQVLAPSKMGAVVTYDEDGTRHESGPPVPNTAKWDQFGACLCPAQADNGNSVLKWGGDVCEHFKRGRLDQVPQLVQLRR